MTTLSGTEFNEKYLNTSMTTLSGTEFNEKYPNTEFYKVLTTDCKHYETRS